MVKECKAGDSSEVKLPEIGKKWLGDDAGHASIGILEKIFGMTTLI